MKKKLAPITEFHVEKSPCEAGAVAAFSVGSPVTPSLSLLADPSASPPASPLFADSAAVGEVSDSFLADRSPAERMKEKTSARFVFLNNKKRARLQQRKKDLLHQIQCEEAQESRTPCPVTAWLQADGERTMK